VNIFVRIPFKNKTKKWNSIFTIISVPCTFQQNLSKKMALGTNVLVPNCGIVPQSICGSLTLLCSGVSSVWSSSTWVMPSGTTFSLTFLCAKILLIFLFPHCEHHFKKTLFFELSLFDFPDYLIIGQQCYASFRFS
jgi:hypothetical protein